MSLRRFVIVLLTLCFFAFSAPISSASDPDGPYIGTDVLTPQTVFYLDAETPLTWTYFLKENIVDPYNDPCNLQVAWTWIFEDPVNGDEYHGYGPVLYRYFNSYGSSLDPFVVTHTPPDWGTIKAAGTWNVETEWKLSYPGNNTWVSGTNQFTVAVTPEPSSSALFIAGAIIMFFTKRKKLRRS